MTFADVEAVVVHTDVESIGEFECSDPLLSRIHVDGFATRTRRFLAATSSLGAVQK